MGYGNPCCGICIHKDDNCYCSKNSACTDFKEKESRYDYKLDLENNIKIKIYIYNQTKTN